MSTTVTLEALVPTHRVKLLAVYRDPESGWDYLKGRTRFTIDLARSLAEQGVRLVELQHRKQRRTVPISVFVGYEESARQGRHALVDA